jgi:hypothetical protein
MEKYLLYQKEYRERKKIAAQKTEESGDTSANTASTQAQSGQRA